MKPTESPPKFFLRFFRWYCHPQMLDYIEGDLMEVYDVQLKTLGKRKADLKFIIDVLLLFRPGIIKTAEEYQYLNNYGMYKSYFKIGWRNLIKNRNYSALSIIGLSVSIALSMLILHYSIYELHFDRFFSNADRIYRITSTTYEGNQKVNESAETTHYIASILKEKLPEIVQSARLMSTRYWFDCTLKYGEALYNEHNLYYADPTLLSIFSLDWENGNTSALDKPFSAVLSASVARRYFGNEEPLGKVLHLKGSFEENDYTVTGVIADLPSDTHLDFTILLSSSSLEHNRYFKNFTTYTYVEVAPTVELETVKESIRAVSNRVPELIQDKSRVQLEAQPATDIHLHSSLNDEIKPGSNPVTIYFLMLVAGLILFIAWINHVNLVTAKSATRIREAGIRKVTGANRFQLISQLLIESFITNGLSIVLAVVLMSIFEVPFYEMTGLSHSLYHLTTSEPLLFGLSVLSLLFVGVVVAGWYPAWTISSFNPALLVKGKFIESQHGFSLRKTLIVFQFTCAIGLTSAVLVFNKQFRFLQGQDLGIDIRRTLIIKAPTVIESTYASQLSNFKTHLQAQSIITSVTNSSAIPGEDIGWTGEVRKEQSTDSPKWNFVINIADADFIDSYSLKLVAGRNFIESDYPSGKFGSKIEPVILNLEGLKTLGYSKPDEAIDNLIFWGENQCRIVGVINDFHQQSPKDEILPLLLSAGGGPNLSIKLGNDVTGENISASIQSVQDAWKKFFPGNPFDYFFLDSFYDAQYTKDKNVVNLFHVYCGFAVMISCLGLFGLASFTVQQRTKEIGIRKILGASVSNILLLLSQDFIKLILIASIISGVISYAALSEWLQGFAYRVDIGWELFVASGAAITLIGILTISYKSRQAATVNPVKSLRAE